MAASPAAWHTRLVNKKTASKGASRKAGAAKKSRTRKRSDAKRRKAPASRSPAVAAPEAATTPLAPRGPSDAAIAKGQRVAKREAFATLPRAKWVALIKDPKQRTLASAAAEVCAIFGIPPDVLRADRKDQSPRSRNENSFRGVALGAVIDVGIAIGLGWNEMHTHPDTGRSEVIDLPPHAATIRGAHERWTAAQAMDGIAIEVARQRVAAIRTAAVKAAALGK